MPRSEDSCSKSVLIVEDDPDTLEEIVDGLGDYGITTHVAETPDRALELAAQYRPRFVLMDFHLPGPNGLDTMRVMRRFLGDAEYILMSGVAAFHAAATVSNTGALAILKKPFELDHLARHINREFGRC